MLSTLKRVGPASGSPLEMRVLEQMPGKGLLTRKKVGEQATYSSKYKQFVRKSIW